MSEFDQTDELLPEERPDEEEFAGTEPGAESDETGTHYSDSGEPELTPNDLEITEEATEE